MKRTPERRYHLLEASTDGVANRWREQYPEGQRVLACGESVKKIQDALDALLPDSDPEKAAKIIGNKSWTHPFCSCCQEYVLHAVQFGDATEATCLPCLDITAKELRKATR
jgi:hypothetical protein